MSNINDKYLQILGILRSQDIHGYQLNDMLKSSANAIRIGKANAYQLLNKMEQNSWVQHYEERENKRPPRQVYSITTEGEAAFQRLLRERLSNSIPSDYPDGVSLNFILCLDAQEAVPLLKQRIARLADRCEDLSVFSDDIRATHPGLDYLVQQTRFELDFLKNLMKRLRKETKS